MTVCSKSTHEGGCLCGAVRYRVDGPVDSVAQCHCNSCRRASGAAFMTWFTVPRDRHAWTEGMPAAFPSSPGVLRMFCGICGTGLVYANERAATTVDITLGSLDCASGHPADRHVWTAHRLDWLHVDGGLPAHDGWSTEG
jgi:hypothetical protein